MKQTAIARLLITERFCGVPANAEPKTSHAGLTEQTQVEGNSTERLTTLFKIPLSPIRMAWLRNYFYTEELHPEFKKLL